jgi:SAM-dependent methyltransferase
MADSCSSKLQLWEGWAPAFTEGGGPALAGYDAPLALAHPDQLFAAEALGPAASYRTGDAAGPYSLQWYLDAENLRLHRYARWIPSALEFTKHVGEVLLGLGPGLGTDWVQYARHGATVLVGSPSAEQLALVRRNFELRGLAARFLACPPSCLPVESASVDVVCLTNLLQAVADPPAVVDEVFRVLKPGGKVLAVAPARYDIEFWRRCLFPWLRWLGQPPPSGPARFSARGLRALFPRFAEHRVHKRHLRRSDVPPLWRLLPTHLLQKLLGRFLVLKAFKPLSAALQAAPPLAA